MFCEGMELPISYKIPDDCLDWLSDYLAVDHVYYDAIARPVDVLTVWSWCEWDAGTIARRLCISRRYANDMAQHARAFDKHICAYYAELATHAPVVDVSHMDAVEVNRHGLNLNKLARLNRIWREYADDAGDMLWHIDKARVRELIKRIG